MRVDGGAMCGACATYSNKMKSYLVYYLYNIQYLAHSPAELRADRLYHYWAFFTWLYSYECFV